MGGTTTIKIDYYEELKRKADFVDKMVGDDIYKVFEELKSKAGFYDVLMKFTKTGDARVSLTDKASYEVIPFLSRIKETKNV